MLSAEDGQLQDEEGLLSKIEAIQKEHKVAAEASAKVPNVKWEDVGGL